MNCSGMAVKNIITLCLVFVAVAATAQEGKQKETNNGLIYSTGTIARLKTIADSLNVRYKVCDLLKLYQSVPQGRAVFVAMGEQDLIDARKDIDAGISIEAFENKYPAARIEKDLLVTKHRYKTYGNEDRVQFAGVSFTDSYGDYLVFDKDLEQYGTITPGRWVYEYYQLSDKSKTILKAFYFPEGLKVYRLAAPYSRMVQYTDCMVDTSTEVFYKDAYHQRFQFVSPDEKPEPTAFSRFMDYVHLKSEKPLFPETAKNETDSACQAKCELYNKEYDKWYAGRFEITDVLNQKDKTFRKLFADAKAEAMTTNTGNDEFEEYVGRYISKTSALELKRKRVAVGACSEDDSPRYHAFNITLLAAETARWDVFLRAHLDIMNDNFERAAETNVAKARRSTYIKELEVLDINVLELLLGSSLRVSDAAEGHYWGDIGRIGKALAETDKPLIFEAKIERMLRDNALDDYNRVLMYFVWHSYLVCLSEKASIDRNAKALQKAISILPPYLSRQITLFPAPEAQKL